MKRNRLVLSLVSACLLVMLASPLVSAYPKPKAGRETWKLDFTFKKPAAISMKDIKGVTHWYWYMPYEVVNNTNSDQLFVPDVLIADNLGHLVPAGTDVPVGLFEKIKKHLGNRLLISPMDVVGTIKQGPDFAKESVAIWPAPKQDVQSLHVFVGGLSSETATMTVPGTQKKVLLRRTLEITFKLPGVYKTPEHQPVVEVGTREIMR